MYVFVLGVVNFPKDEHRSNATPVTLSKQNNRTQWNAYSEFQTIRYNLSVDRNVFEGHGRRPESYTIRENMTPATENETICKWIVEFVWEKTEYDHVWSYLYFQLDDDGKAGRAMANLKAALLDDCGREVHSKEDFRVLDAGGEKIRWWHFIDFDKLNGNPFVQKNPFIISIEISYYYSRCSNLTYQQNMISPEPNTTKCVPLDNFISLLGNQDYADVILLAKGKNYSAHKAVLAARSEVFPTMFQNNEHGDKKHRKIRIDVTDIDAEVMDELLRYIYTGKCQISDKLAERLYAAADAYKLKELKTISLRSMVETLSVKNAVNVLIFADKHHMKDLKSTVTQFIVENSAQVSNTTEWKSMVIPNVQLLTELCQIFMQRLSTSVPCEFFCKSVLAKKLE
ncbi:speckle-type POZ protein-like isoform X2 [Planococcus citri]|uniref:speckle-type POZ protein-like isoform X2 n=1 Tax=Planococcus citri TaxID=170843 RepID=UPI0031F79AC5